MNKSEMKLQLSAGYYLKSTIYNDEALGYCSDKTIVEVIESCIEEMIEDFAIVFYQVRGEL